jgi:RHS repeat-associated protein
MLTTFSIDFYDYKFGFNGQEKEDEVYGEGNLNYAKYWMYDTRLGRRWNIDPVDQISISNYATFANNPIVNTDPLGDRIMYGWFKNPREALKRYKAIRQRADWNTRGGVRETYGGLFNFNKNLKFRPNNDVNNDYNYSWGSIQTATISHVQRDALMDTDDWKAGRSVETVLKNNFDYAPVGTDHYLIYDKSFGVVSKPMGIQPIGGSDMSPPRLGAVGVSVPYEPSAYSVTSGFEDNKASFINEDMADAQIQAIARTFRESQASTINIEVFTAKTANVLAANRANEVRRKLIENGVPRSAFQGVSWFSNSIGVPGVNVNLNDDE